MTNLELQTLLKNFKDDMEIAVALPVESDHYYADAYDLTLIKDNDSMLLAIQGGEVNED